MKIFNRVNLPELDFDLTSETGQDGRKYVTPEGDKWPSVTTILKNYNIKAIMEWRERVGNEEANRVSGHASRRGTKMHSLCEQYILGELDQFKMMKMMPLDKMMFGQMRPMLDEHVDNVYCLEQALYSNRLRLAGRVDLIAEWDGELAVVDFKSAGREKSESKIRNYFMQCSAYAEMFGEITNRPINKIVIAIANEEQLPQVFVKDKAEYLPDLHQYINKYWKEMVV